MDLVNIAEFFSTARERERIRIRRNSGLPAPWTDDKILQDWRFCQVHRENDRTTTWFRENIRNPLNEAHEGAVKLGPAVARDHMFFVVRAPVIFRWFNRIETGEKIKELITGAWNSARAREILKDEVPVVTGAYIIKGADGMSKLDGVLYCIDQAVPRLSRTYCKWMDTPNLTLQQVWDDLRDFYYLGPFMAYEIVSDLRWTPLLDKAPDINTWANAGPGCARGLGWALGERDKFNSNSARDQKTMLSLMQEIIQISRNPQFWPQDWRKWEMREAEHWSCEFDKYKRAQSGLKLKRRFKP